MRCRTQHLQSPRAHGAEGKLAVLVTEGVERQVNVAGGRSENAATNLKQAGALTANTGIFGPVRSPCSGLPAEFGGSIGINISRVEQTERSNSVIAAHKEIPTGIVTEDSGCSIVGKPITFISCLGLYAEGSNASEIGCGGNLERRDRSDCRDFEVRGDACISRNLKCQRRSTEGIQRSPRVGHGTGGGTVGVIEVEVEVAAGYIKIEGGATEGDRRHLGTIGGIGAYIYLRTAAPTRCIGATGEATGGGIPVERVSCGVTIAEGEAGDGREEAEIGDGCRAGDFKI